MKESRHDTEVRRQRKLEEYRVLDTDNEALFDELVRLAAQACDTPMAIVSLMDADRQWFKASVGMDIDSTPRKIAFCDLVIRQCRNLVVDDAALDPRFIDNPLVTGKPNIRFYAGVPLLAADGSCIGTLAVMDSEARSIEAHQVHTLQAFSKLAMHALDLRLTRLALKDSADEKQHLLDKLDKSQWLMDIARRAVRLGGWHVDLASEQITWSEQAAVIHEEPPGHSPRVDEGINYYAPEHRRKIREAYTSCATRGVPFDEELQLITARGRRRWVRTIGEPEHDPDGSIIGVQGAILDISERKRTEEALRLSEERYRHAAEASQAALWDYDMITGKVSFSETFRNMLGYARLEDMPDTLEAYMQLMHPEDRDRVREKADRMVDRATEDRATAQFRLLTQSGDYRWVESNSKVIRDEQGRAIRRLGSTVDIHERRLAEQQLREQAERMRGVLETACDAIITIDEYGVMETVNPAATEMFGYRAEDMLGQGISILMTDRYRRLHDDHLKRYRETGEARIIGSPQRLEARRRDGTAFPIELTVGEVHLPERRIFTGFISDVTEQETARSALEDSEERFRAVARASTDVIYDYVMESGELWWSDGLEAAFGYTLEEAGNDIQFWIDHIHPDDQDRTIASLEAAFEYRDQEWSAEYRFLRKDGRYAQATDSGVIIRGKPGKPDRMVGGMKDVTEQRVARRKLAEQAELLNKARDAIFVTDLEGTATYWNHGAERLYGWQAHEIQGNTILKRVFASRDDWDQVLARLLEAGGWDGQMRQLHRDGHELQVQCHLTLVLDKSDQPRSILAINTDITEKIELEEQLRQAQRLEAIGQLTGGVAHDFNNLLTVILGNAELLSETLETGSTQKGMADLMLSAAGRGAELTNQLLAFARRQALEPKATDVLNLVQAMQPLLRRSIPENIEIRISPEPDLWLAEIDPGQLESALLNLALNARDAMPEGGRLSITISNSVLDGDYTRQHADVLDGEYVQVAVTDNGQGIGAKDQSRIFEPFFTTKQKGKGTGLGLPMVYGFIKQSRGHIAVYSEPGMGTTVRMYLPRAFGEASKEQTDDAEGVLPGGSERILVVEDDELVLEHVRRLICQLGYEVATATSGDEALQLARSEQEFDLLFTDVIMPGGHTGPDLAREIRRIHPDLRVLFTSGYTEDALTLEESDRPSARLLQKPYPKAVLARALREALDKR
ncbi:PAS domain S-box protein [Wenzhouxiangella sp. AB-CW3]|uniref:PAS domain S-box protein n=1 Tax=Wenzhouxiangella sp. AB-CW3 TaxID=2771012 RepID=UPI00168A71A0|nr:PAS domain S-box protein [Wenzhouxiangella sp. AB-CW3]QOC22384.1 PAS domain S-box protein [Wenzhouxiangella sp. AB-CW3]